MNVGEQLELPMDYPISDTDTATNVKLVELIEQLLDSQDLFSGKLWSTKDVAHFLGTSERTAQRILRSDDAPAPVVIPTSKGTALARRWVPDHIIRYFKMDPADVQRGPTRTPLNC